MEIADNGRYKDQFFAGTHAKIVFLMKTGKKLFHLKNLLG